MLISFRLKKNKVFKVTMKINNKYIEEVEKCANKSNMRCKHGCIIISKKGKIVSRGYNRGFNSNKNGRWSIHAEIDAIKNCYYRDFKDATLLVIRLKDDQHSLSKPCLSCQRKIEYCMKNYGLSRCYYS